MSLPLTTADTPPLHAAWLQPATPRRTHATAVQRAALSLASLAALAVGLIGLVLGAGGLREAGLLVYLLLGIGAAPWATTSRMRLPERLSLTFVVGLSTVTLGALAMETSRSWHPWPAFIPVALVTAVLHVRGLARALPQLPDVRIPALTGALVRRCAPAISAVSGGALCLLAAATHRHINPSAYGFLREIGPLWYLGLLLLLVAIATSRGERQRQLALAVALLAVVLTLTPSIVYDGPRSQSAGKHVDFVQQIRSIHRVDSSVPIYDAWSGFFAAMAWVCDVIGLKDPLHLATLWPALLAPFRVAALRYLFGRIVRTPYQAWIGVTLAVLADPIGADYFSPQSVGFVMALAIFGLALSRWRTDVRLTVMTFGGSAVAVSHQLSPYITAGTLVLLVLFRRARPWWSPATVLVPALVWAGLHFDAVRPFLTLGDIGQAQNFRPPQTLASAGLERLPIIGETVDALVVGILLLGLLALWTFLRRWRSGSTWMLAMCPAVGLVLVAANPYGQEGIFRAALFGLPWLAALAADRFRPAARGLARVGLLGVILTLVTTFCVASFGLDATSVLRPGDMAAFRYFKAQGATDPVNTYFLLNLGTGDLPSSPPAQAGTHLSLGRDDLGMPVREEPNLDAEQQARELTKRFLAYSNEPAQQANLYSLWSPVSSRYAYEYGLQRPSQFAALRDAFLRSPSWRVVFTQGGTVLFRFVPTSATQ